MLIEDSYTLIPEDQPAELARCVHDFVAAAGAGRRHDGAQPEPS